MWLMGLTEEFDEAHKWVEEEMVIGVDKDVNLFETTIRVLGGLLSTFHLTGDKLFYDRAVSTHAQAVHVHVCVELGQTCRSVCNKVSVHNC